MDIEQYGNLLEAALRFGVAFSPAARTFFTFTMPQRKKPGDVCEFRDGRSRKKTEGRADGDMTERPASDAPARGWRTRRLTTKAPRAPRKIRKGLATEKDEIREQESLVSRLSR